jgi:excisionase family DNA binding protein
MAGLRAYVVEMPAQTQVPVLREVLLELLSPIGAREPVELAPEYTVTQVARMLGCAKSSVRGYINSGLLPAYDPLGRKGKRVRACDLAAFRAAHKPDGSGIIQPRPRPVDTAEYKAAS